MGAWCIYWTGPVRGFRDVHSPRSRGGARPPHLSPWFCIPATRLPCAWGHGRWSGKLGRREQRQRVGPDSLLFPCLDSLSGAAEPPPRSFIKSGMGAQKPALSHLLLSSASAPLSLIRHGEREPRPFIGGGEGRRQTAHLSLSRARGGRASHKGKREGARSRTRSRTRSRRSGKRRTGRRTSFASAGGSSPHGGPYRGRPLRVLRQAAPGSSSSPSASSSVCARDGVGPARDTETAHEGLWDQRHASPRCIPSP